MTQLFLKLLNMSITASWIVLAVIVIRILLRKAPKWISCILWSVVALRLILPFSVESIISLIPSPEVIPQNIIQMETPAIQSAIPVLNSAVNPLFTGYLTPVSSLLEKGLFLASVIWAVGLGIMLLYSFFTYLRIRWQVQGSIRHEKNIYICDDVDYPFILGIIAPRIYIPSGMEEARLVYVLAHENAHIKRLDHWWKPLGFLLLSVYWFNPLLWVAYIFLCRDIEMACDEKVIADMDSAGKRDYSEALIACSVRRQMVRACPLAFGGVSIKSRIKGVLYYRKPTVWIVLVALLICILTAGCFLTNPRPCDHTYQSKVRTESTCTEQGVMEYTCTQCEHMYTSLIDKLEHSFGQDKVILEPTCTQLGGAQQICAHCQLTKTVEVPMIAHTAGEPYSVKEPNCTEQGERTATCVHCTAVFQVEVLATNDVHDMKETVVREATCTEAGEGVNTCTRCEHSESIVYQAAGHNYETKMQIPATCTTEGSVQKVCSVCDKEIWNSVPKTDEHRWFDLWGGLRQCGLCGITQRTSGRSSYSLLDGVTYTSRPPQLWPSMQWSP